MDEALQEETVPEPVPEKIVDFPLPEQLIKDNIGLLLKSLFGEGYIYTRIILSAKKLTDIENLRPFVNLFYVDISKNYLENLDALEDMAYLLTLNASFNKLTDISSISQFQYLVEANFERNQIETLPQINIQSLKKLNLNYNKITTLVDEEGEYLIKGNMIRILEARNNLLTSTIGINLPWLTYLYLAGNQITDIQDLLDHRVLVSLHLRDNKIENLNGLHENIPKLRYLNLRKNKISDLQEVAKLVNLIALEHLVLRENPIEENEEYRIAVLKCLPHIKRLDKTEYEDEDREQLKVEVIPEEAEQA